MTEPSMRTTMLECVKVTARWWLGLLLAPLLVQAAASQISAGPDHNWTTKVTDSVKIWGTTLHEESATLNHAFPPSGETNVTAEQIPTASSKRASAHLPDGVTNAALLITPQGYHQTVSSLPQMGSTSQAPFSIPDMRYEKGAEPRQSNDNHRQMSSTQAADPETRPRIERSPAAATQRAHQLRAAAGQRLTIPCANSSDQLQLRAGKRTDTKLRVGGAPTGQGISLIVWHKDSQLDSPIFTVDARGAGSLREAKQQTGDGETSDLVRGRVHFEESARQAPALVIEDATKQDAGLYTCTVELHKAPTQTFQVQVSIINPPQNMVIRSETDARELQPPLAGPYDEQSSQTFACEVDAGEPPAQMSWWRLDSTSTPAKDSGKRRSKPLGWGSIDSEHLTTEEVEPGLDRFVSFHSSPAESGLSHLDSVARQLRHWTRVNGTQSTLVLESGKLQSSLQVTLARTSLGDEYLCLASNDDNQVPLNVSIKIDMNLKPTEIRIENKSEQIFKLGQKTIVQCQIEGSRPSAKVRWFRGSEELNLQRHNIDNDSLTGAELEPVSPSYVAELSRDLNSWTKVSYLTFVPRLSDNQQPLTCSAHNPQVHNSHPISDSITMNVQHAAIMNLTLGANIRADSVKIGADVFMDCNVQSNPPVSDLTWSFNDRQLQAQNLPDGLIMSNMSLVIQKVRIEHRGTYQCIAHNPIGRSASNKLELRPQFKPICDYAKTRTKYEVAVKQSTRVECNVLAEPGNDLIFTWKFNQTHPTSIGGSDIQESEMSGYYNVEDIKHFETNFTSSSVIFTPETKRHYGQLLCSASNTMGKQDTPCIIRVIPSELPDPVFSCFFDNQTQSSLSVHCQAPPSQSGSGRLNYQLEVYANESVTGDGPAPMTATHLKQRQQHQDDFAQDDDHGDDESRDMQQVLKLTSSSPSFHVSDLKPSTTYNLMVYVQNSKGRSPPASYRASTLPLDAAGPSPDGRVLFQSGFGRSSQDQPLSERLKSLLKIGDYFGADNSKPVVGIAIIVITCSISIFMVSFLVSRMCRSSSSRTRRDFDRRNKHKKTRGDSVGPMDPLEDERLVGAHQLASSSSATSSSLARKTKTDLSSGFPGNGSDTSRETNTDSTLISSPRPNGGCSNQQLVRRDSQPCCSASRADNNLLANRAITWHPNATDNRLVTPSPISLSPHVSGLIQQQQRVMSNAIYSTARPNNNLDTNREHTPQVSIKSGSDYSPSQNVDDQSADRSQIVFIGNSHQTQQPIYVIGAHATVPTAVCELTNGADSAIWGPCVQQIECTGQTQLVASDSFEQTTTTTNSNSISSNINRCRILSSGCESIDQHPTAMMMSNSMSIPVSLSNLQHGQRRYSHDFQVPDHLYPQMASGSYLTLTPDTLVAAPATIRCQNYKPRTCVVGDPYSHGEGDDPPAVAANLSPPENFASSSDYSCSLTNNDEDYGAQTLDDPRRMGNRKRQLGNLAQQMNRHHSLQRGSYENPKHQHRVKFEQQVDDSQRPLQLTSEDGSRLTLTSTETDRNLSHYL